MSWPSKVHPAGGRGHQTRDGPGEGALAGTVDAQDGQDGTRRHLDRDAEQRLRRAVADVEVLDLEQRLGHAVPVLRPAPASGVAGGESSTDRCGGSPSPR